VDPSGPQEVSQKCETFLFLETNENVLNIVAPIRKLSDNRGRFARSVKEIRGFSKMNIIPNIEFYARNEIVYETSANYNATCRSEPNL
jgi:hypothetical protein